MDPVTASLIASSVGSGIKEVGNTILGITKTKEENYTQRDSQRAGARSTSTTTRTIILAIVVIFISIVFWQLAKK